jgi:hypothetical protein
VGKLGGKRPLVRPRLRREDNISMGRKEIGSEGVDWIHLAQDRDGVACSCECGNEPSYSDNAGNFFAA